MLGKPALELSLQPHDALTQMVHVMLNRTLSVVGVKVLPNALLELRDILESATLCCDKPSR